MKSTIPHNEELESAVIGSLMSDIKAIDDVAEHLKPELFYKKENSLIAKAIIQLYTENNYTDMITVTNQLRKNGTLEQAGGYLYLAQVQAHTIHVSLLKYVLMLKEYQMKRDLLQAGIEAQKMSLDEKADAFDSVDSVAQAVFTITEGNSVKEARNAFDIALENVNDLEKQASEGEEVGMPTYINNLDNILLMKGGTMNVFAARPAMGKTALILQIAKNIAKANKPVGILSLEMRDKELIERIQSNESNVPLESITKGKMQSHEWNDYLNGSSRLKDCPIYVDDTPALSVLQMRSKARMLKRKYDIKILMIDYLQLMQEPSLKNNREQEISYISRSIKQIAKDLDIVVIPLAQLSRAVETRGGDKRPILSDLRDSGSIEQDSDSVTFLYRPEYYGISEDENGQSTQGVLELIIAKQRNGSTGTVKLKFDGKYQRVSDSDSEVVINNFEPAPIRNSIFNDDIDKYLT